METIYSNNDWRSYSLAHSGRLGQKWGVKHGPPYPLGERQLTGAYRKNGGVSKSAAERDGVRPGAGSTNGRTTKGANPFSRYPLSREGYRAEFPLASALERNKKDSDKTEKAEKRTSLLDKMKAAKAKKEADRAAKDEAAAKAKKDADRLANLEKARAQKAEKKRLAEEYEKEQKDFQERAQKAIDEGDKEWAMENFSKLTNKQIDDVIRRADLNMKLDAAGPKEKDGWDKMDEFVKKVGKVRDWVNDGTKTWNTIAKINNSINPNLELPVIKDPFNNNQNQGPDAKEKARREKVEKAIRSGDAKKIAQLLPEMKTNEVEEANKRINNANNIKNAAKQNNKQNNKDDQQSKSDKESKKKEQERRDKVRNAINSGDISKIEKELPNMTSEEVQEAVDRMTNLETLNNMAKNKKP